jgi:hypothetical protein
MIINLTQHPATPEQIDAGVVDFTGDGTTGTGDLLIFLAVFGTLCP